MTPFEIMFVFFILPGTLAIILILCGLVFRKSYERMMRDNPDKFEKEQAELKRLKEIRTNGNE